MGRSRVASLILAAAVEKFAEHGYTGVSTKEIAVAADVTEGSLFRLFRSKDRLFAAALEKSAEGSLTDVQLKHMFADLPQHPESRNVGIVSALAQWYRFLPRQHARMACFALLMNHDHSRPIAERVAALARVIAAGVDPKARERRMSEAHARGLLYALFHHKAMGAAYGKTGMNEREFATAQIEAWLKGMKT